MDQDISFREYGSGDPVLILHGLFGSGDNWRTVARSLSRKYKVFTLDMRNHGKSFHSDRFDYHVMMEDVVRFVRRHDLERVSMIGHSMGGKVAMNFALAHPDLVRKLVIVDIANKAYETQNQDIVEALYRLDVSKISKLKDADEMLREAIPETDMRLFLISNLKRQDDGRYQWQINVEGIRNGYQAISEKINGKPYPKPCLFIRGGQSEYIQDSDWPDILRVFPLAELVTIPRAGHWVHIEARDPFVHAVSTWLER